MHVRWLNDTFDLVEIILHRPLHASPVAYHASPLAKVKEAEKDDEVRAGDWAVLVSEPESIAWLEAPPSADD